MSNVLFINGNLHGHINPTLPIVKELVAQGETVYYCSTSEFQQRIEATGANFINYGHRVDQFLQSFRPHGNHPFYTLMEYILGMDLTVVASVIELAEHLQFDYIIHDIMFGGGNILAHKLGIPAIASCSSFVMEKLPLPDRMLEPGFHPQLDHLLDQLKLAKSEWSLPTLRISELFFKKEALNLVYTSKLFQPKSDCLDNSYCFVGPSIDSRNEELDFELSHEHKTIYISMGTIENKCIDFYNRCIEAFANTDYQVIMSIGKRTQMSDLHQIPDNFIIRDYIPQLEVLKHADIMISHGGLNSVSEALYFGVPIIAIPISNDQPAVAKRLVELGAGIGLKMDEITAEVLQSNVYTILANKHYRIQSAEIGDSFREAGGYKSAVEAIIKYKSIHHI
ncbi:glycosyl transferase family 1 [Lachnospiraceae bacterium MD1]|uniref:Glycosyl transferase family 1 n=1 Tax=Variimorphobacter saccharofermentans TaxID=2755051 RepID=A0A839K5P2_9FIRM|nr:macrolide family glycosyltransferase [Variimorphobacter saccharofermentans]MBB2184379.1 glycosyl transferase family 1 [Variimorphobacter saccharofermentans]